MKITTLLLLVTMFNVMAGSTYSQDARVSLDMEGVSIKSVLTAIEDQTEFLFLYSTRVIDVEKKVNIHSDNQKIDFVLEQMLKGTDADYIVQDRQILLVDKNTAELKRMQQIQVTGTVIDEMTGETLPGVYVMVQGTNTGAVTDVDGKYLVRIPSSTSTLVFSFVGYVSQTVPVSGQSVIDIVLAPDVQSLEEVVVIGYGTVKKKDVTGAVASANEELINSRPVARLDQALMGSIPGLDVQASGGTPGASTSILLRGKRSFQATNDPLLIVDGMPFYGDLNDISPSDVQSVDVLKDASSAAIYGSRGANGVIIITTKRGRISKPVFNVDSYAGPELKYGRIPLADAQEYAAWAREAYRTMGGYPDIPGVDPEWDAIIFDDIELATIQSGGPGPDYLEELTDNGFHQRHQLSVTGGTEAVKYNFSGNYFRQEGLMPDDIFNRITLSTNLDVTINPKLTSGISIQIGRNDNTRISTRGAYGRALAATPLGRLRDEDGNPEFQLMFDSLETNPMIDYWWDSYRYADTNWSALLGAYGEYKILPSLTYRINLGTTLRFNKNQESQGYYSLNRNKGLPTASLSENNSNTILYESILTFNKTFNDAHTITATAVHGIQTYESQSSDINVMDYPYEPSSFHNLGSANTITGVASGLSEWALLSYVGRINYGYKSKYLLSVSLRADGASQFAEGHKWGYFPSASIAYRIIEENFMKSTSSWLSDLKLRVSYGVTGNQGIQPYQVQGALARTAYAWGDANAFGYRPLTLANKELKWESTSVVNVGLDFGFYQGRIAGNIDFYNTNTYDLLMYRKLPIHTGYDQVLENVGEVNNKGFEVGLRTINIDKGNFMWTTNLSFSTNNTEIVSLYSGKVDDVGSGWFIGHPLNVYYDYEKIGIWQLNEAAEALSYGVKPGQIKLKDQNNDGKHNDLDRVIIGDPEPDWVANISNTVSYKNWDLGVTAYIRWGGTIQVSQFMPFAKKRYNKIIFDYWTPEHPTNAYPRPNQLYEGSGLYGSTLGYRDASYIQISQASLGYTLPQNLTTRMRLNSVRLYVQSSNPFYWTKSELSDFNMKADLSLTSTNPGGPVTYAQALETYHATRTVVFGISLNF